MRVILALAGAALALTLTGCDMQGAPQKQAACNCATTPLASRTSNFRSTGVFDLIAASLKSGDEVRLTGFGVFVVATRAGGKGRNPQTGEEITIKPSKQPRFRAGKQLKDSLN